jgi:asparagine synthase (glutamine-hydrolysing)
MTAIETRAPARPHEGSDAPQESRMRRPGTSPLIGDFVVALGPGAARAIEGLAGFETTLDGELALAVRGSVRRGTAADGSSWLALADLIEGRLDDGARALGADAPHTSWRGRFAQVAWNAAERRIAAITDHLSTLSIYTIVLGDTVVIASDLRLVLPLSQRQSDPLAIYHYLNFGYVPAPYTICRDVQRLLPGTRVAFERGARSETRWFVSRYAEDLSGSDEALAKDLREHIVADVRAYRPEGEESWGCFLSGGTDSSSIVSIFASQKPGTRVKSVSIGFGEEGYDELGYATLVADAVGANAFTARVDRSQAVGLVSEVLDAYDQPFGDASAIPTLACAALAAEHGLDRLVAGDGGDEIFGGNERYAKDHVMETFYRLPSPVRAIARGVGGLAGRSSGHFLNRVHNFVERGSLPNPDRFYTDDSFGSDYYEELLAPEFRREAARDASLDFLRRIYALGEDAAPLHRIMRLDLSMAIAQNDLVKVRGACRAHGISTRFPYLDPALIDYTGRLPARYKVRGLKKRYLFKRAMVGILPEAVLTKKKQGFGLPVAVWLRQDPEFQSMVRSVLFDEVTLARGLYNRAFLEKLMAEHARGTWDHSRGIWQILVLELWLRKHLDAR